jgi:hypothetical protein
MNCEEARQHLLDLIYPEEGSQGIPSEFREHFTHCSGCSGEYLKLLETRQLLSMWPDEEPLQRLVFAAPPAKRPARLWLAGFSWRPAPALAFSFCMLLVFLALVRIHVSWEDGRFAFQSSLIFSEAKAVPEATSPAARADILQAVDKMLSDSEQRQNQQTLMLMQRMADNLELKRQMDMYQVKDALGLINQDYHQALEKNSVLLEQAAKYLKQTRY